MFVLPAFILTEKMEIMKQNKINYWLLGTLFLGLVACGDDKGDYIPPAIEEPETPPAEDVYNKPDFELHEDGKPFDTYRGLVMAGYQEWFGATGDGCRHSNSDNTAWYHYRESEVFKPGVLHNSIVMCSYMSEYEYRYTPGVDGPKGRSSKFILPKEQATVCHPHRDSISVGYGLTIDTYP